ncbi:protein stum homolog [Ptychodera flava]|uniref:protein stum homolog n=1 Tax=Ptychodera flava TaxID=63121 RepID=UPI00396A76BB
MSYPKQTAPVYPSPSQPPSYDQSQGNQYSTQYTVAADPQAVQAAVNQDQAKRAILKYIRILPAMHQCMAWTCFIFNCIIPGIGTWIAAFTVLTCCAKHPTIKDRLRIFCINFWCGLGQLVTLVLVIGYIWAIYWGWGFIMLSYMGYHGGSDIPEIHEVVAGKKEQDDRDKQTA